MSRPESRDSVIAIFDIGKTNKKFLLFNTAYEVVFEKSEALPEIVDEDGDPCEDVAALSDWMKKTFAEIQATKKYTIQTLNFSGYGASFVHLGRDGKPAAPLYNYLKSFPSAIKSKFYSAYGDENEMARVTASPILGNLNSGMLLYFLKHAKPNVFKKIEVSLHLPQYLSYLFTGHYFSDITSIGCHTQLWDFEKQQYHAWVRAEKLDNVLPPIAPSDSVTKAIINGEEINCGIGLHDSSAALIPYLKNFTEPFMLLSTGTWSISLNPFNHAPLTKDELAQDCLCYLAYDGKPVKASRLFSGYEHEQQAKRLSAHFNKPENYFGAVVYQPSLAIKDFNADSSLSAFTTYEEAYHALIGWLVRQQLTSSQLVLKDQPVKRIFVDGGFCKNDVFMNLLAKTFPSMQVYASSVPQASALGAALVMSGPSEKTAYQQFPLRLYDAY